MFKYFWHNGEVVRADASIDISDKVEASKPDFDVFISVRPVKKHKKQLKDVLLQRGIITQQMYDEVA